jgi:hypothetical protein
MVLVVHTVYKFELVGVNRNFFSDTIRYDDTIGGSE